MNTISNSDNTITSDFTLEPPDNQRLANLCGQFDEHLRQLEQRFGVEISNRGHQFRVIGLTHAVQSVTEILNQLYTATIDETLSPASVDLFSSESSVETLLKSSTINSTSENSTSEVVIRTRRRVVKDRGINQRKYLNNIVRHDINFGIGPAGTGKCIAYNTPVLTGKGLLPMAELASGLEIKQDSYAPCPTLVYGLDGPTYASHIYNGGVTATRKLYIRQGFTLEGTPEHPLLMMTPQGEVCWRRLDELHEGDYVGLMRGTNLFGTETRIDFHYTRHSNDSNRIAIDVNELTPDLAYFMGILVGNGRLTQKQVVVFTTRDQPLREFFLDMLKRLGLHSFQKTPYELRVESCQLYALLQYLGLSNVKAHQKQVPSSILRAPKTIWVAFLQGLFDTKGRVSKRDGIPSFSTSSQILAQRVQLMLLNLGIVAFLHRKETSKRLHYLLEMRGQEADNFFREVGFRLSRQQKLAQQHQVNIDVVPYPYVVSLVDVLRQLHTFPQALHKEFLDYRIARRAPSYAKLREIISLFSVIHPLRNRLQWLLDRNLFWSQVVENTPGQAQVYDLTVPQGHSFVAGGFVNHNTYLAVARAVEALEKEEVRRLVLVRPAVEAGEHLGFLPGDLAQKVDPYLRPLYDALYEMLGFERVAKLIERGMIEIAPLAFMRGRTLNGAFIILDEAQNTTTEQMKMFLTRIGFGSTAVVTGDVTQSDLPHSAPSGLRHIIEILKDIEGISFTYFGHKDVVRHPIVARIIKAYECAERKA